MFYVATFIFLTSIVKFSMNFKFYLTNLICLEFMVLLLFFWQNQVILVQSYEQMFLMIFLTFSVCEGVTGISLLICMLRSFNNNFIQSISITKC